jgi:glutathionyl-hydroquinone reductase
MEFSKISDEKLEEFEREFHQLSDSDEDPISQWLKLAKARGETRDTDDVLLNLMVELHRKMDKLEMEIKGEKPKRIELDTSVDIDSIGYEHFHIKDDLFEVDAQYYGRVTMPVHPKRDVAIYFKAVDNSLAEIVRIHERDEKEWSSYLAARERVLIRQAKQKKAPDAK